MDKVKPSEVKRLRAEGYSIQEIGTKLNRTRQCISKILKNIGCPANNTRKECRDLRKARKYENAVPLIQKKMEEGKLKPLQIAKALKLPIRLVRRYMSTIQDRYLQYWRSQLINKTWRNLTFTDVLRIPEKRNRICVCYTCACGKTGQVTIYRYKTYTSCGCSRKIYRRPAPA